jgi:hypothetical protein
MSAMRRAPAAVISTHARVVCGARSFGTSDGRPFPAVFKDTKVICQGFTGAQVCVCWICVGLCLYVVQDATTTTTLPRARRSHPYLLLAQPHGCQSPPLLSSLRSHPCSCAGRLQAAGSFCDCMSPCKT